MTKTVLLNGMMNLVFCVVFVFLNNLALEKGLEETFVSLAVLYGAVVVVGNVLYVLIFCKQQALSISNK